MKKVAIIPNNAECLAQVRKYLEDNKEIFTKELMNLNLENFKEIRFAPLQSIFKTAQGTTKLSSSEAQPVTEKKEAKDPFIVNILKELMLIASEFCSECTKEIIQSLEENKAELEKEEPYKDALSNYVKVWDSFFLSALEIDMHLSLINDIMNSATEILIQKIEKKVPKFSVWRVLVGAFRTFAYMPLSTQLQNRHLGLVQHIISAKLKTQKFEEQKQTTAFDPVAFLAGKQEFTQKYESEEEEVSESFDIARFAFQAMLDMSINEVTVHYMNSKELLLKICKDFTNQLISLENEIFNSERKQHGETKKFAVSVCNVLDLLKIIFPPCMWDDIELAGRKTILSVAQEKLVILAQEFSQFSKEEQAKRSGQVQPQQEDKLIIPLIQSLKKENGKPWLTGESLELFIKYLFKEHNDVYKECAEQRAAFCKAQSKEIRVEDLEIQIKNKCLDILVDEDTNAIFKMGGMNISQVRNIA